MNYIMGECYCWVPCGMINGRIEEVTEAAFSSTAGPWNWAGIAWDYVPWSGLDENHGEMWNDKFHSKSCTAHSQTPFSEA